MIDKRKPPPAETISVQHDFDWYRTMIGKDLTEREIEVLAHMTMGRSNREIAKRLHISVTTVSNHCHNILEKMLVNSRGKAAAIAREFNIVSIEIDEIVQEILAGE